MKKAMLTTVILMILGCIWLFPRQEEEALMHQGAVYPKSFVVEITGAVSLPGKYVCFEPLSVREALELGGDLLPDADLTGIVFSDVINSHRTLRIPSMHVETLNPVVLINVNKASFKELITIPSMTETRAASLIVYREAHGAFGSVDELIHVKHIGIATLEKIRPYVTVG
jgi:competence protein ComEA